MGKAGALPAKFAFVKKGAQVEMRGCRDGGAESASRSVGAGAPASRRAPGRRKWGASRRGNPAPIPGAHRDQCPLPLLSSPRRTRVGLVRRDYHRSPVRLRVGAERRPCQGPPVPQPRRRLGLRRAGGRPLREGPVRARGRVPPHEPVRRHGGRGRAAGLPPPAAPALERARGRGRGRGRGVRGAPVQPSVVGRARVQHPEGRLLLRLLLRPRARAPARLPPRPGPVAAAAEPYGDHGLQPVQRGARGERGAPRREGGHGVRRRERAVAPRGPGRA